MFSFSKSRFFLWWGIKATLHPKFCLVVLRNELNSFGCQFPQRKHSSRDKKNNILPEVLLLEKQYLYFLCSFNFVNLFWKPTMNYFHPKEMYSLKPPVICCLGVCVVLLYQNVWLCSLPSPWNQSTNKLYNRPALSSCKNCISLEFFNVKRWVLALYTIALKALCFKINKYTVCQAVQLTAKRTVN